MSDSQGGYACTFAEEPSKEFQTECPVCLHVLREPYQVNCCGYAFCRECIEMIESDDQPCPCCKEIFEAFEDKRLKRSLYAFKVHCSIKEQGCQWVGELGQLDNHLNLNPSQQNQLQGCQLSKIKCLHCSEVVLRSDIEDHQNNQCPRRPFSCEYCKEFDSSYEEVTINHWPVCGSYPVPCTNKCGETLQRQNLESHITNDCPLTIINCDFQHVGCEVRLPRKDMPEHLRESVVDHLSKMSTSYKKLMSDLDEQKLQAQQETSKLQHKIKQLETKVSELNKDVYNYICRIPVCPCEFTITNYARKKVNKVDWKSPPFYSHPKGYKMRLEVCTNYWIVFDGITCVTAFIHLLGGEFDDYLDWPYKGKVHVTLLSQDDDEEHHTKTIDFSKCGSDVKYRVYTRDASHGRYGLYDFMDHKYLSTSYKKNDCLKFSIDTECA